MPLNDDPELPAIGTAPPLLREHRLYQADWLLRYYGFQADELLSSDRPNFNTFIDPKCDWALRHLELFPVEAETASYAELLRVPWESGPKISQPYCKCKKIWKTGFYKSEENGCCSEKSALFHHLCGKQMYHTPVEETYITRQLVSVDRKESWENGSCK